MRGPMREMPFVNTIIAGVVGWDLTLVPLFGVFICLEVLAPREIVRSSLAARIRLGAPRWVKSAVFWLD